MKLAEFGYSLKWFLSGLTDKPLKAFGKWWARKTVRITVICSAALIVAVPLAVVLAANIHSAMRNKKPVPEYVFTPDAIDPKDIFIPEEPDFLPPVLLEQEQKEVWLSEDASKFWTDPGEFSREFWQERITDSIDRLLETLP
jgi:hypothetical protein